MAGAGRWELWAKGPVIKRVEGIEPRLASWSAATDPDQMRVQAYVRGLTARLGPPPTGTRLYLHLDVAVRDPRHFEVHHDLENYLTPLFQSGGGFDARDFHLVTARKLLDGPSAVEIGVAEPAPPLGPEWRRAEAEPGSGSESKAWKVRLRDSIAAQVREPAPAGPIRMHLAWRCAARRNWANLWKPTGDALAPILDGPEGGRSFNPRDDRIVELSCHRSEDDALGHDVRVGVWWRNSH